ncbi:MAG: hypothetical protein RLY61_466 [Candidatus Parcubacteria bacterium]|jgi:hypothetical protein
MDAFQLDQLNRLIANIDANLFSLKRLVRQLETPPMPQTGVGDMPPVAPAPFPPRPQAPVQDGASLNPVPRYPSYPVDSRIPPMQPAQNGAPTQTIPVLPQQGVQSDPLPQVSQSTPASPFPPMPQRSAPMPYMPQQQPTPATSLPPLPQQGINTNPLPPLPPRGAPTPAPQVPQPLPEVDPATVPGVEGTFDGTHITTPSGEKIEVPAAYASKTRILFGDTVKMYDDNGEKKFKVMVKQPRKKLNALSTKKDNKWYALTGLGAYKISDSFAEFNKLGLNDPLTILVPEGNLLVPFAAIDEVQKPVEVTKPVEKTEAQTANDRKNTKMIEEYDLV